MIICVCEGLFVKSFKSEKGRLNLSGSPSVKEKLIYIAESYGMNMSSLIAYFVIREMKEIDMQKAVGLVSSPSVDDSK